MRRFNPLIVKIMSLLFLVLCFMIPVDMVRDLIRDRQFYQSQVEQELTQSTSGEQTIAAPILVVPYQLVEGKTRTEQRLIVLPEQLNIDGQVQVSPLKRAIYTFQTFQSTTALTGHFSRAPLQTLRAKKGVTLGTPFLAVGVSDARGLGKSEPFTWDGKRYTFSAGTQLHALPNGMHAALPLSDWDIAGSAPLNFSIQLNVNGSSRISYVPLGENTQVTLAGNWPHPKFAGSTVTQTRNVMPQGFNASWQSNWFANNLNTTLPSIENSTANGGNGSIEQLYRIDTDLIQTVDHYQLNERMAKYSMLFIGLTFLAFFMFEVLRHLRVHPLQYALVGVALTVFFVLLLSLSEHMGFNKAYALVATACVGQIGFYVSHILHSVKRGIGFSLALATLYAALFGLLQSEDISLLLGSIGLFAVVSVVMFATRRLNWYALADHAPAER